MNGVKVFLLVFWQPVAQALYHSFLGGSELCLLVDVLSLVCNIEEGSLYKSFLIIF